LVFTNIKDNKITKPDTESGNVPVSISSRVIFTQERYDEFVASNKTIDDYLKSKTDDYNDFLNYYDNFDTFTSIDFITRIEQEYLTEDYNKKLKIYIKEIASDAELKKLKTHFIRSATIPKTSKDTVNNVSKK
jgi:CRISPR/Cas system-associated endonuclease/helicase Cas3